MIKANHFESFCLGGHLKTGHTWPSQVDTAWFKGGTSLAKVYKVIERFSEDVDIVLNRHHALGFTGDQDPPNIAGTNKRNRKLDELAGKCSEIVQGTVHEELKNSFRSILGEADWTITVDPADADGFSGSRDPAATATVCHLGRRRGGGHLPVHAVNQRAVPKRQTESRSRPAPPFRPLLASPGRRWRVSPVARTPYYGRFSGSSWGLLTG